MLLPLLHQQVPLTPYDLPMPDGKLPKFPSVTTKSQSEKCQKQVYQVSTPARVRECHVCMDRLRQIERSIMGAMMPARGGGTKKEIGAGSRDTARYR